MAFDYKKEYKEFYLPKDKPSFVTVPPMNYLACVAKAIPMLQAVSTRTSSASFTELPSPSK